MSKLHSCPNCGQPPQLKQPHTNHFGIHAYECCGRVAGGYSAQEAEAKWNSFVTPLKDDFGFDLPLEQAKPCPQCGGTWAPAPSLVYAGLWMMQCEHHMAFGGTEEEAIENWNDDLDTAPAGKPLWQVFMEVDTKDVGTHSPHGAFAAMEEVANILQESDVEETREQLCNQIEKLEDQLEYVKQERDWFKKRVKSLSEYGLELQWAVEAHCRGGEGSERHRGEVPALRGEARRGHAVERQDEAMRPATLDLLPCPFCGAEGKLLAIPTSGDAINYRAQCSSPTCRCNVGTWRCGAPLEAIQNWNDRAPANVLAAQWRGRADEISDAAEDPFVGHCNITKASMRRVAKTLRKCADELVGPNET